MDQDVVCYSEWWDTHIVGNHPELAAHDQSVRRAIGEPFAVYRSNTHPARHVFYRPSDLPRPFDRGFLRVVVDYSGRELGRVITAFHVAGPKSSENTLLWPRDTK